MPCKEKKIRSMKKTDIKQLIPWTLVAGWMVVIFLFSAQTADDSSDASGAIVRWILSLLYRGFGEMPLERQTEILQLWHTVVRKGAHFAEYAVLSFLVANALRTGSLTNCLRWLLPVAVSAVYAVTDEIHQYFVPGRACRLLDVGIDTCGAIFGMCVFTVGTFLLSKNRK